MSYSKQSSQLFLSSYNADIVNHNNSNPAFISNAELTWFNVNFQTILGSDYEIGAMYNLVLNEEIKDTPGSLGTANRGQFYLMYSPCMHFNNSSRIVNGIMQKSKGLIGTTAHALPTSSPIVQNYGSLFITSFRLTAPVGNVTIGAYFSNTHDLANQGWTSRSFSFDIYKIKNRDMIMYYPINNIRCCQLFLNSDNANVYNNNTTYSNMTFYNIDLRTILGDYLEIGAKYNLVMNLTATQQTAVTLSQRCQFYLLESNCFEFTSNRIVNGIMQKSSSAFVGIPIYSTISTVTNFGLEFITTFKLRSPIGNIRVMSLASDTHNLAVSGFIGRSLCFDIYKLDM